MIVYFDIWIIGVRHPEELSLLKQITSGKDKKASTPSNPPSSINRHSRASSSSSGSINKGSITPASPYSTQQRTPLSLHSPMVSSRSFFADSPYAARFV